MSDLNLFQAIGRLGKAPDMKYLTSGEAVAGFSIACGSQWKNKAGEKQESTEWVNCTAFGKLAEICSEYLQKGSQVYVSGRMKTDKYQAKDGTDRYSTKIIVDRMQMLGGKKEATNSQETQEKEEGKPVSTDNFDDADDIPFN